MGALGTRGDLRCKGESQTHVGGNSLQGEQKSLQEWWRTEGSNPDAKVAGMAMWLYNQEESLDPDTCRQGMRWRHSLTYPSNNIDVNEYAFLCNSTRDKLKSKLLT